MVPIVAQWDHWNTEHLKQHGVTPQEVEEVLANASSQVIKNPSSSSDRPAIFGTTKAGRPLLSLDESTP
jgi:hypothetical protein